MNWRSHCTQTWVAGDGIEQRPVCMRTHKYTRAGTCTDSHTGTHTLVITSQHHKLHNHHFLMSESTEQEGRSQSKGISMKMTQSQCNNTFKWKKWLSLLNGTKLAMGALLWMLGIRAVNSNQNKETAKPRNHSHRKGNTP